VLGISAGFFHEKGGYKNMNKHETAPALDRVCAGLTHSMKFRGRSVKNFNNTTTVTHPAAIFNSKNAIIFNNTSVTVPFNFNITAIFFTFTMQ
jgi:hypothetical protein